jgi:hypothetical protein
MLSRLFAGAGALAIILAAGHAMGAAEDHASGLRPNRKKPAPLHPLRQYGSRLGRDSGECARGRAAAQPGSPRGSNRALAVNREVIAVTRGMRAAAETRYAAGQGDQAAVIKALGEGTAVEIEAARLEGDHAAAQGLLNALLARPANAPLAEPLLLRRVPAVNLATASLMERARGSSPALAASGAEVDAARTRTALAEKAWYPDLTVGAGPLIQTNNRPAGYRCHGWPQHPFALGQGGLGATGGDRTVGRGPATLRCCGA